MKYQVCNEFGTVLDESNNLQVAMEMAEVLSSEIKNYTYLYNGNSQGRALPFGKPASFYDHKNERMQS